MCHNTAFQMQNYAMTSVAQKTFQPRGSMNHPLAILFQIELAYAMESTR
jgi:hypothetical protein